MRSDIKVVWVILFCLALSVVQIPANASSLRPISIGVLWDLSGPNAKIGSCALQAARQVVSDVNAQGGINGHPVQLLVADTGGEASQLLSNARSLVFQQGVLALIGPTSPKLIGTLWGFCTMHHVPLVLTCGYRDMFPLNGRNIHWIFSVSPTRSAMIKSMYQLLNRKGITNIGILTEDDWLGNNWALWLRGYALEYREHCIGWQTFGPDDTDMSSQMESLLQDGAQAVITCGYPSKSDDLSMSAIASAATVVMFPFQFTLNVPYSTASLDMISVVPPVLVPDCMGTNSTSSFSVSQFYSQVMIKLEDVGPEGIEAGGCAWDAINLIVRAINSANGSETLTRLGLRDAIETLTSPYSGVMGTFKPYKDNHCGLEPGSLIGVHWYGGQWHLFSNPSENTATP